MAEHLTPPFDAVIVAAGSGNRLGFNTPKAFVPIRGMPMLSYSVKIFLIHPLCARIILVVPPFLIEKTAQLFCSDKVTIVTGGTHRWESVRNGCLNANAPWILVHDAARPLITLKLIDTLLATCTDFQCAFSAVPVVDTIRKYDNNIAQETIDRSTLVRVHTPQLFETALLVSAFQQFQDTIQQPPTDEIMLMQKMGITAGIAWGDPKNFKITTKEDLEMAEALICASESSQITTA